MEDLDRAVAELFTVRDCPAVRRLALDCYLFAGSHGAEAGLSYCRMLRAGITAYVEHEKRIRGLVRVGR